MQSGCEHMIWTSSMLQVNAIAPRNMSNQNKENKQKIRKSFSKKYIITNNNTFNKTKKYSHNICCSLIFNFMNLGNIMYLYKIYTTKHCRKSTQQA